MSPSKRKDDKDKWNFRHKVKVVKKLLQIVDVVRDPQPGLSLHSKQEEQKKKPPTLPPVYATGQSLNDIRNFWKE